MKIVPEKTAISNGISNSCKMILNDFCSNKDSICVLDYGCGRLRNTIHLLNNGIKTSVVDTKLQLNNNSKLISTLNLEQCFDSDSVNFNYKYDVILLSFVLNVIPEITDRVSILYNISNLIKDDGTIYIEVRNDKFVKNLKNKAVYNDGLVIGNGEYRTFQKPYSPLELEQFLKENNFEILLIKKISGSIIAKVKKGVI